MEPAKISVRVTLLSGTAPFTVYTNRPSGGVNKPASIARIPNIAKALTFHPAASANGQKTGTVKRMIDMESIKVPSANHIIIINTVTPKEPKPMPLIMS